MMAGGEGTVECRTDVLAHVFQNTVFYQFSRKLNFSLNSVDLWISAPGCRVRRSAGFCMSSLHAGLRVQIENVRFFSL